MPKKKKRSYRNNGGAAPPRPPRPPRAPRPRAPEGPQDEELTPGMRLLYTACGAAGTALLGGVLARQDWKPMTIATVLTGAGSLVAWTAKTPVVQSVANGTMASAGGQLALQVMDDRHERAVQLASREPARRQAGALPPGALEAAFERARLHAALISDDYADEQLQAA